jgi:hypothetical protein
MNTSGASVDQVYKVSSSYGTLCPVCGKSLSGYDDFAGSVNHMLAHGWQLLHLGAEHGQDDDGKSIAHTVAVLGRV